MVLRETFCLECCPMSGSCWKRWNFLYNKRCNLDGAFFHLFRPITNPAQMAIAISTCSSVINSIQAQHYWGSNLQMTFLPKIFMRTAHVGRSRTPTDVRCVHCPSDITTIWIRSYGWACWIFVSCTTVNWIPRSWTTDISLLQTVLRPALPLYTNSVP
jgi:hypothetical protein